MTKITQFFKATTPTSLSVNGTTCITKRTRHDQENDNRTSAISTPTSRYVDDSSNKRQKTMVVAPAIVSTSSSSLSSSLVSSSSVELIDDAERLLTKEVQQLLSSLNKNETKQQQQQQHSEENTQNTIINNNDILNVTVESTGNSTTATTIATVPSTATNTTTESQRTFTSMTTPTWYQVLLPHFSTKSFLSLASFLWKERCSYPIYPKQCDVWTALNECPLTTVKVVIVGQDPYHNPNQAHGMCFSVQPTVRPLPPSLINIYKEIANDLDLVQDTNNNNNNNNNTASSRTRSTTTKPLKFNTRSLPVHGHLIQWARQGVLLLNTVMTVRKNQPNSHQKHGWEQVTDEIIRAVVHTNQRKGIVFLLWGKPAYAKATNALQQLDNHHNETTTTTTTTTITTNKTKKKNNVVTKTSGGNDNNMNSNIVVISTSHPSPLGATKTATPFIGSRCFSKCNQALVQMGHTPIDWNVD